MMYGKTRRSSTAMDSHKCHAERLTDYLERMDQSIVDQTMDRQGSKDIG